MKPLPFFVALLTLTTSCYQSSDELSLDQTSTVSFNFEAFGVTQEPQTRASMTPSQLLIIDCYNGKADTYTQTSLAEIPIPLTWGQHDIYFVACSKPISNYDVQTLTVTWPDTRTGMEYVWAKKLSLEVTASTASQSVNLPLICADVKISTLDNLPTNMGDFKIDAPDICRGLKLSDMSGYVVQQNPEPYVIDCRSHAGEGNLTVNLFTLVPTTKSLGDIVLTAYDATSTTTEIASHTLPDVPVNQGYVSSYTGYFFSDGVAISLTSDEQWTGTNDYEY